MFSWEWCHSGVSVFIRMIWSRQSSVWVAVVKCHSICLPCLFFPSVFAGHFLWSAIQTANCSMPLLCLYGTFVLGISVLPTSANATGYQPKPFFAILTLFIYLSIYLFIYILLGKSKSILSVVNCFQVQTWPTSLTTQSER